MSRKHTPEPHREEPREEAPAPKEHISNEHAIHRLVMLAEASPRPELAAAMNAAKQSGISFKQVFEILVKYGGDIKAVIQQIYDLVNKIRAGKEPGNPPLDVSV